MILTLLAVGFFCKDPDFHWSLLYDYLFGTVFWIVPTSVDIIVEAPAIPLPNKLLVLFDPLDFKDSFNGTPDPDRFET